MIAHITIHKLFAAVVAVIATFEAARSGAEGIVLAATTIAALGYLWVRVVRPTRAFFHRVAQGIDHLEQWPHFRREVFHRLDKLDSQVAVMADADRHRIKDAIAGDQRSPIDRRS